MLNLIDILRKLRSPEGCPWDREQSFDTLREFVIEEAYEVVDAIEQNDMNMLCEELGDLLLQIAFQSVVAEEMGVFDYNKVEEKICSKMISRHPHVFGKETANNSDEVLKLWNKGKMKEKGSILSGIPSKLPALLKAHKVHKRIKNSYLNKVEINMKDLSKEEKIGKELYEIVIKSSKIGIQAEDCLNSFIKKLSKEVEHEG
ncbi:MAG: MazG family protein [Candidatus Muirbacterium halophilum]|nr:MazG family protein [Candidatus Muirbacterium halophilum]MCK9476978.1 MazG family protein [Candidatus Muirbacterium halophilum]